MSTTGFTVAQQIAIPKSLSRPRFQTYLHMAENDTVKGLKLYEWNLRLSSALMVPIAIAEVALRNAVDTALTSLYGTDWPWDPGFIKELPNPPGIRFNPRRELIGTATRHVASKRSGKVVADLKFVWWEKILRARHEGTIWNHKFHEVFPNAPSGLPLSASREILRSSVEDVREVRNRIAHHEPIIMRNVTEDLKQLRRIAGFVSPDIEEWLCTIENVTELAAERPA